MTSGGVAQHSEAIFVASLHNPSRHKVNPGLLYTPRGAGGIGLVCIDVAIYTRLSNMRRSGLFKNVIATSTRGLRGHFKIWRLC